MNIKNLFIWLLEHVYDYNIFLPDEDDYNDNDDSDEPVDPAVTLKHQLYSTRLYIPLLIITLYILTFVAVVSPQNQSISVSDITPVFFNELYRDHADTLSCPCSTIAMPYGKFVSHMISFHPVCSSTYVSKEWIQALYLSYASSLLVMDFRTTAKSQFELLAAFCSISQETVFQSLVDVENEQFVTSELFPEDQVQFQIVATIDLIKNSIFLQKGIIVSLLQITTQSNFVVSALNTNAYISVSKINGQVSRIVPSSTRAFNENSSRTANNIGQTCDLVRSTVPAGFYSLPQYESAIKHSTWPINPPSFSPSTNATVDGFFAGCTPLDGLLVSTLECLYSVSCLKNFPSYFPNLNQTNISWSDGLPSSTRKQIPVGDILSELFVANWSSVINYTVYFTSCAPKTCTYSIISHMNVLYTGTLLLALYGGVTILLRSITPYLVFLLLKLKLSSTNHNRNLKNQLMAIKKCMDKLGRLNLFKSISRRTEGDVKLQRMITRIYLILLASAVCVLLVHTSIDVQIVDIPVLKPLLREYRRLQQSHSNSLKCSCSNTVVPYQTFVAWAPRLHSLCTSDFVSETWIPLLSYTTNVLYFGYRLFAWNGFTGQHFRLLSTLCQLANKTVTDAVHRFGIQTFVTLNVTSEDIFNTQLDIIVHEYTQSFGDDFYLLLRIIQLFTQADQPYTMGNNADLVDLATHDESNHREISKLGFNFTGPRNIETQQVVCICATDPRCQTPVRDPINTTTLYNVPGFSEAVGMITSCFTLNSVLLSTLECYYSHSCVSILYKYINATVDVINVGLRYIDASLLIYNSTSSRFPPNTSLSLIIKELMIEEWNPTFSFEDYYKECAPSRCIYSQEVRRSSLIDIMIRMLATIGGIIVILRLVTPSLIRLIINLLKSKQPSNTSQRQLTSRDSPKLFSQVKTITARLIRLIGSTLINLNFFPRRIFGGRITDRKARYFGQLSTRLYIVLLIVTSGVLAFYYVLQLRTIKITIDRPDIDVYKSLLLEHGDTLQCRCSSVASKYNNFVQIQPIFHPICSSLFVSEGWYMNITSSLAPDLFVYDTRDYRRFLSSHLQLLSGLCSEAMQSVNSYITQFLESFFLTDQLIPASILDTSIHTLVNSSQLNAPNSFVTRLSLLRAVNYGNAIISSYGTNFEYIDPWVNESYSPAITQSIVYADECSCALHMNCTVQAGFVAPDSLKIVPIKGLKIGCTPSEAFLSSTLECFYNSSCLDLILQYTNNSDSTVKISILSTNNSQYSMDSTVLDLVTNVFIEKWITSINYSVYFQQCSPSSCSYTYRQRFDWLYTVTVLIGYIGGLTLALQWLCPKIIILSHQLYRYSRKQKNAVDVIPQSTLGENHVHNLDPNGVSSTSTSPRQFTSVMCRYIILGLILFMGSIAALVIVSIYLNKRINAAHTIPSGIQSFLLEFILNILNICICTKVLLTTIAETTTSTTVLMTTTSSTESSCKLTFQQSTLYTSNSNSTHNAITTGDFNGDSYLDIALVDAYSGNLSVFLNNNDETFSISSIHIIDTSYYIVSIACGDFNSDYQIDLAVAAYSSSTIIILIGNGEGIFQIQQTISVASIYQPTLIAVADFNGDTYLDIVVNGAFLGILSNFGNGFFSGISFLYSNDVSYEDSFVVADLNNDNYLDLATVSTFDNRLHILINNGYGYFRLQTITMANAYNSEKSLAVADFNSDNQPDLAIALGDSDIVNLFIQKNGTFAQHTAYSTGAYSAPNSLVPVDFNNDGYADLAVVLNYKNQLDLRFGIGESVFSSPLIFSIGSPGSPFGLITG
ncbi:unnamed protein product, partial [Adineta ricciae]